MNRSEPRDIKRIKAHGPFEPRQYVSAGIEFIDVKEAAKCRFGYKPGVPLDTHGHLIKRADAATAEATGSVLKELLKFCGVAAIAWLVFAHLGPTNWQPRTGLGWQIEHFLGYFLVASIVCLAWAPAIGGRGGPHGRRATAGGPARLDTGSPSQFSGCIVRRRGSTGGGSAFCCPQLVTLELRICRHRTHAENGGGHGRGTTQAPADEKSK